jgi:hypothetical protein
MEEKNKSLITFLYAVVLLIVALIFNQSKNANLLWGSFAGVTSTLFISFGLWVLNSWKNLRIIFCALFIRRLRLSCSYLYQIKVDNHYLLIKSRKHGRYQPVGGNFKKNKYSHLFLKDIELAEDDKISCNERTTDDLRLYIKGRNFLKFLKWYNSPKKEREISYDREFYEELVEPGILPQKLFPYPVINFCKQEIRPISFSKHFQCKEIHIYDIVELITTEEQHNFLRNLKKVNTDSIKWATIETIRHEGYQGVENGSPYHITDHSIIMAELKVAKS